MSRSLLRRLYTTAPQSPSPSPSPSASQIAAQFLSHAQSRPPHTQTHLLDGAQLHRLSATLSRTEFRSTPPNGTKIPPAWHLVYFTPAQLEEELGLDGTDTTYNAPHPFTRRMWAGGELEWVNAEGLEVGQTVKETTRLVEASAKTTRTGEEMIVVGVRKEFENERGVVLVDKRNWIFRPPITTPLAPVAPTNFVPISDAHHYRDYIQSPVTLFRFSALTFNAHKIHYNREWCREVEGHRDLVVHGPLNLVHMVDLWRDMNGRWPRRVTYRNTKPVYVGERYRILMDEERGAGTECRLVDDFGGLGMVGRVEG
ncbi:Thioesterase/thiol ester dehydrase-isomerase [Glarea lozoyensis ATCC 20868]|uniref:Thioesterase/thiol ester dehydrase-isomerase n=1 Tax=Glarea lozoyensis (strain ATCC 20868 / MF5171) TaxID=1116229 RepID=S3DDJ1_GLAL2|nr:Thioesterase/thiol ester dehydrase-isomerase [Glarea lozoyensis ATCC 20868]EPE35174.1 Thioesterase/thiol ester dehydrase-isomerase [Glarea lozoyensis ATCC 20868]